MTVLPTLGSIVAGFLLSVGESALLLSLLLTLLLLLLKPGLEEEL